MEKVKMAEPVSSGAGAVAIKMHGLGVFICYIFSNRNKYNILLTTNSNIKSSKLEEMK